MPVVEAVPAAAGSDVTLSRVVASRTLAIDLSGGSDLRGAVAADLLSIRGSGGSDAGLAGRVAHLVLRLSGASDFAGVGFVAGRCTVAASGGSDVLVTVNDTLTVQASGGSRVRPVRPGRR